MKYKEMLFKKADITNDVFAASLANSIPIIGPTANAVGGIAGIFSKAPDEKLKQKINDRTALSYIPGVGAANIVRQRTGLSKSLGAGKSKTWSEAVGPLTSSLLLTGLAAAIGAGGFALADKKYKLADKLKAAVAKIKGPNMGDIPGSALANVGAKVGVGGAKALLEKMTSPAAIGALAGGTAGALGSGAVAGLMSLIGSLRKTRTAKEQAAYEHSGGATAANWLVPGAGAYNLARAAKRIQADDPKAREARGE